MADSPTSNEPADLCDVELIDADRVRRIVREFPAEIDELAGLYRALGDPTRLKMALALASAELCVCDLAAAVGASSSGVSHHLRLLKAMRLVRARREGKMVYYRLDDDHVREMLAVGREHVGH